MGRVGLVTWVGIKWVLPVSWVRIDRLATLIPVLPAILLRIGYYVNSNISKHIQKDCSTT